MAALVLTVAMVLSPGFTGAAGAASEDVAMFYDDLAQYGQWVEVEKYGPVWQPSQVAEDWRPYTNGRWVPTEDGNVFETEEPWGWATYHYGNWMPTEANGWVWVPGRTWYPSTVEWRSSPESEPVDNAYIGWAPTPPPDYVPPESYAPASYYQGSPVTDSLIAPLWIFVKAASFLLGFGQPYAPAYSYMNSGYLVPPTYVPVFYSQTVFIPAYATPTYYPPAFFGGKRFGPGYYNRGPMGPYLRRFTGRDQADINRIITRNSTNITRIHHVVPPRRVLNRHGYLRQIMPPALVQGRRLPPPGPAPNVKIAQVNLNRPNFVPPPKDVPRLTATIPRVQPVALQPGRGLPGTALPPKATMPLTPQMTQQIEKLPPKQQFVPGKAQPFSPVTATPPGAQPQSGKVQPGAAAPPRPAQPGAQPKPGQFQPGPPIKPVPVQPGAPPASRVKPGEFHPGVRPGTPATPTAPRAAQPGTPPLPPGPKGVTPEQRRQQEREHQRLQRQGASGSPPKQTQGPPQVKPQAPPRVQPQAPRPQVQPRPQPQPQPRPQPQVQPRPQPQPRPQVAPRPQPQPQPQKREEKKKQPPQ